MGEARANQEPGTTLAETVKREALEASRRRRQAGTGCGLGVAAQLDAAHARATFSGTDLQALAIEMPADAVRAMRARWPEIWAAVRASAERCGDRPIPAMVRLIEAGLAAEAISSGKDGQVTDAGRKRGGGR